MPPLGEKPPMELPSFLRGSNSSQNKLKPPRSGKVIIICTVKTVTRGSHKKIVGGGGKTKNAPSSHYGEKDPPRGENSPYVEKKTSHIKNAPIGRKAPYGIFYSCSPGQTPTFDPPLRASIMTSTHFILLV